MNNKTYKTILEKRKRAQELRAFRPGNMTEGDLIMSPDLEYIGGEFSTFDPNLAQLMQNTSGFDRAREYMKRQLTQLGATAMNKFAARIACQVFEYVYQNAELTKRAVNAGADGDINAWNDFFEYVIEQLETDYSARKLGGFIDVKVIDSWADIGEDEENALPTCAMLLLKPDSIVQGATHYDIYINRQKVRKIKVRKSTDPLKQLIEMVKSFAHEYTHFLDYVMPNRGALGSQFFDAAKKLYIDSDVDYDKYRDNPLEISAFRVSQMLHIMDAPEK